MPVSRPAAEFSVRLVIRKSCQRHVHEQMAFHFSGRTTFHHGWTFRANLKSDNADEWRRNSVCYCGFFFLYIGKTTKPFSRSMRSDPYSSLVWQRIGASALSEEISVDFWFCLSLLGNRMQQQQQLPSLLIKLYKVDILLEISPSLFVFFPKLYKHLTISRKRSRSLFTFTVFLDSLLLTQYTTKYHWNFFFFFLSLSLSLSLCPKKLREREKSLFSQPTSCPPPPAAFSCLQKIANGQHDDDDHVLPSLHHHDYPTNNNLKKKQLPFSLSLSILQNHRWTYFLSPVPTLS